MHVVAGLRLLSEVRKDRRSLRARGRRPDQVFSECVSKLNLSVAKLHGPKQPPDICSRCKAIPITSLLANFIVNQLTGEFKPLLSTERDPSATACAHAHLWVLLRPAPMVKLPSYLKCGISATSARRATWSIAVPSRFLANLGAMSSSAIFVDAYHSTLPHQETQYAPP